MEMVAADVSFQKAYDVSIRTSAVTNQLPSEQSGDNNHSNPNFMNPMSNKMSNETFRRPVTPFLEGARTTPLYGHPSKASMKSRRPQVF